MKVSEALPFIEKIAKEDKLNTLRYHDMEKAFQKFQLLRIICEQQGLDYTNKRQMLIAKQVLNNSINNN